MKIVSLLLFLFFLGSCSSAPYSFHPKYEVGECVINDGKLYLISEIIKRKRYEVVELNQNCINNLLDGCHIQEVNYQEFDSNSKASKCL